MTKKIIYTTGVYDMFHLGHFNFLKEASSYGNLLVGVTSDQLVLKEKNKLPVINQNDRIDIIKNLPFVYQVILHENSDKLEMHKKLKFTHCVIGSDWKGHSSYVLFEKKLPEVKFIYLPYTKGISSTFLRTLLNNNKYHIKHIKLTTNEKIKLLEINNINNYPDILPRNCDLFHKNFKKKNLQKYKGRNSWMELKCLSTAQKNNNVVKLIGWYLDKNNLNIITEKFGKSLKDSGIKYLTNNIVYNILKSIHDLHNLKIHHNDITSENILIGGDENIKLCDFGWSNCVGFRNYASDYYYCLIMLHELGYRNYYIGELINFNSNQIIKKNLNILTRSSIKDNTITDNEMIIIINKIRKADNLIDLYLEIASIIFKKFNITPYLAGGFLIGYLRNKKKIPWDHDLDFHMTRQEFSIIKSNKFKSELIDLCKKYNLNVSLKEKTNLLWEMNFKNNIYIYCDFICDTEFNNNNILYIDGKPHDNNDGTEINRKSDIYPLSQIKYKNFILYIPNNPKVLVKNQYGLDILDKIPNNADNLKKNTTTTFNFNKNINYIKNLTKNLSIIQKKTIN
jgi:glycerol-3-phosphate cytidylyltransferase